MVYPELLDVEESEMQSAPGWGVVAIVAVAALCVAFWAAVVALIVALV